MKKLLRVWLFIMIAEVIHGILRGLFLVPRVGLMRSSQIGVFIGMGIIFAITTLSIRRMGVHRRGELLCIGGIWLVLTVIFEYTLGCVILGYPTARFLADYDIRHGGLMLIGMVFLFFAPLIAARVRRISG